MIIAAGQLGQFFSVFLLGMRSQDFLAHHISLMEGAFFISRKVEIKIEIKKIYASPAGTEG
jgi:hypothetical protein